MLRQVVLLALLAGCAGKLRDTDAIHNIKATEKFQVEVHKAEVEKAETNTNTNKSRKTRSPALTPTGSPVIHNGQPLFIEVEEKENGNTTTKVDRGSNEKVNAGGSSELDDKNRVKVDEDTRIRWDLVVTAIIIIVGLGLLAWQAIKRSWLKHFWF